MKRTNARTWGILGATLVFCLTILALIVYGVWPRSFARPALDQLEVKPESQAPTVRPKREDTMSPAPPAPPPDVKPQEKIPSAQERWMSTLKKECGKEMIEPQIPLDGRFTLEANPFAVPDERMSNMLLSHYHGGLDDTLRTMHDVIFSVFHGLEMSYQITLTSEQKQALYDQAAPLREKCFEIGMHYAMLYTEAMTEKFRTKDYDETTIGRSPRDCDGIRFLMAYLPKRFFTFYFPQDQYGDLVQHQREKPELKELEVDFYRLCLQTIRTPK